jgi:hypothetical protein
MHAASGECFAYDSRSAVRRVLRDRGCALRSYSLQHELHTPRSSAVLRQTTVNEAAGPECRQGDHMTPGQGQQACKGAEAASSHRGTAPGGVDPGGAMGMDAQLLWFESISDKHSRVRARAASTTALHLKCYTRADRMQLVCARATAFPGAPSWLASATTSSTTTTTSSTRDDIHGVRDVLCIPLPRARHARMQQITGFLKTVFTISVVSFVALLVMEAVDPSGLVLNHAYFAAHIAITSALLTSLAIVAARWGYRVSVASRLQRAWSKQQRHMLAMVAGKGSLFLCILVSDAVVTGAILARPHFFCDMPPALTTAQLVRWTCWNTMLLAMTFDSRVLSTPAGSCGKGKQRCCTRRPCQWPKAVIWVFNEGATLQLKQLYVHARSANLACSMGIRPLRSANWTLQELPRLQMRPNVE